MNCERHPNAKHHAGLCETCMIVSAARVVAGGSVLAPRINRYIAAELVRREDLESEQAEETQGETERETER